MTKRGHSLWPEEKETDEVLHAAHFEALSACCDWWQVIRSYDSDTKKPDGYKITVKKKMKCAEAYSKTVVGAINMALDLAEKL